ncbi:MAG: hypothetical protein ABWZ40_01755 [Caulobacterales bacterium]
MSPDLIAFARAELAAAAPAPVIEAARVLATQRGAGAALFYGSNLRTGSLDGVIDFYLLTPGPHRKGLHGFAEKFLWPEVSYHEVTAQGATLRIKVATMPLSVFGAAAAGDKTDTTIWSRFTQPAALVWSADTQTTSAVESAVANAMQTAARFAALHGPERGAAEDYWNALFRATYQAELRFEKPGRAKHILSGNNARYESLLPLAWNSGGVRFSSDSTLLQPALSAAERKRLRSAWGWRQFWGKALNAARLFKAAFTFEGAARYAAWKVERHTGVPIPVTRLSERFPVLIAPTILWRLWRAPRP